MKKHINKIEDKEQLINWFKSGFKKYGFRILTSVFMTRQKGQIKK